MNRSTLLIVFFSLFFIEVYADSCDKTFMKKVLHDNVMTAAQKNTLMKKNCVNQKISVTGTVSNVGLWHIELKDELGISYDAMVLNNEVCGALVDINKGDTLTMETIVKRVIYKAKWVTADKAVCKK